MGQKWVIFEWLDHFGTFWSHFGTVLALFWHHFQSGPKAGFGRPGPARPGRSTARPGKPGSGPGRPGFLLRLPDVCFFSSSRFLSVQKLLWRPVYITTKKHLVKNDVVSFVCFSLNQKDVFEKNVFSFKPKTQPWRGPACYCWRWTALRLVSNYCCHQHGSHCCQPETWKQKIKAEVTKWRRQPVNSFARMVSCFRGRTE